MMRVLLVQPAPPPNIGMSDVNLSVTEPLALETIASPLLREHDVKILDMRFDKNLSRAIEHFQPEIVGVTGFTTDVPNAISVLQETKKRDRKILTVAGGMHASVAPRDFFREWVDIVVIGEGDFAFKEVVNAHASEGEFENVRGIAFRAGDGFAFTNERPLIENLDNLPVPAFDLTKKHRKKYRFFFLEPCAFIETSRGCPHRCNFCSVWKVHRKRYRRKSTERVVEEIQMINERAVFFADDNFLSDVKRADEICEKIKENGIKKRFAFQARPDTIARNPEIVERWTNVGLSGVLVGIESFRQHELDMLDKNLTLEENERAVKILHDNGIVIWGAFIIRPDWDEKDFDALIDYILKMDIDVPQMTVLTPLPGTELFEEKKDDLKTLRYEFYDYLHPVLPTKLSEEEFCENLARLYRRGAQTIRWIRGGRILPRPIKLLKLAVRAPYQSELLRPIKICRQIYRNRKFFHRLTDPRSYRINEVENE